MLDKRADLERRADAIAERIHEKRRAALPELDFTRIPLIAPDLDNTAPEEPKKHEHGHRVLGGDSALQLHLQTPALALERRRAQARASSTPNPRYP